MEKGIIFSSEMVNAILDGRKTQTRRVIEGGKWVDMVNGEYISPYGKVGDCLWVRETWRIVGWDEDGDWCIEYKDGSKQWFDSVQEIEEETAVRYWEQCTDDCIKAGISEDDAGWFSFGPDTPCPTRWRPSIFLPRWASRISLKITDVDVKELQDITVADVLAEGIRKTEPDHYYLAPLAGVPDYPWPHAVMAFSSLWDSINGKRAEGIYSWDRNPWVWVITFKQIKGDKHEPS